MKRAISTVIATLLTGSALAADSSAVRDGSRDFEFNVGTWRTHLVRLKAPLSGSKETVDFRGTVSFTNIWGGAGMFEEIEAVGPNGRWQGLTVFLYNPAKDQWSQRFANSATGRFEPAMFGRFMNGTGELIAQDTFGGRSIFVRGNWLNIRKDSHIYQESYSDDGGQSWEKVIEANLTRIKPVSPPSFPPSNDGAHDFEFDHGLWKTRSSRLLNPLTGSNEWTEWLGTTKVTPIWGGRANIAELVSDGPTGHLELISLRLFDPKARQWSLNFSQRGSGTWSVPMYGRFTNGRGTFYSQEEYAGRTILVRFTFIAQTPTTARSEQAFSDDAGRTWETNWINRYERLGPTPINQTKRGSRSKREVARGDDHRW